MNKQLQKAEGPEYNKNVELIETVRACVFKGSTDSELRLFMFKCQEVGVHPMSQMIIPVAFTDTYGNRKVSFISTIDFFRSLSEDSGDYAGMDEIEFEGETEEEFDGKTYSHPDSATCRVYRVGYDRPFVGKARWSEFYPGDKKGMMWRKMPTVMLGKCAEAQARRLAWPKKLNKLYTEDEMDRGFEALSGGVISKKPNVTPNDIHVSENNNATDHSDDVKSLRRPTEDEMKAGKLISEKQGFYMYKNCKEAGVDIGSVAAAAKVENIFWLTWQKSSKVNFQVMIDLVKTRPNSFAKFSKPAETSKEARTSPDNSKVPTVMGEEEFGSLVASLAMQCGISVEVGLQEGFSIDTLEDVLPEMQSKVIDWFTNKAETPSA